MRIGLVLNILDEEYQISVFQGVKQRAKELCVELICFQQENSIFSSESILKKLIDKKNFDVDGIIVLSSVVSDSDQIATKNKIRKYLGNIPIISLGQDIEGIPSLIVQTDDSMKQLVEHLILKHKYRKFYYISGSSTHNDAIMREQIFIKTINAYKPWENGLEYKIKRGWFTERAAVEAMNEFYEEDPDYEPDVVVCANDNMAIGVYKYMKTHKNKISMKKCAVTGFDDIPQSRFEMPPLTTIRQPLEKIGGEAVSSLVDLINGKEVKDCSFIESELIIRQSCGCKNANENENVNDFVDMMQENYLRNERLLKMVSHIGQDLNYAQTIDGLKYIINANMEQLDVSDYCILSYTDVSNCMIKPVYVRRNGKYFYEFAGNKEMPLGEFFKKYQSYDEYNPNVLVIKQLTLGEDNIGCVIYETSEDQLPYLCSIALNITHTLNRINEAAERKKRAEYLEREVSKRTKELVQANNKRMEVEAEVLKISEIERQRFSTDLHDDICQRLAGISMLCRSYSNQDTPVEKQQMTELAQLIGETLQTTRQYAHNSYPVELDSLGMNYSLNNLCNSFEQQSGIKCQYSWELSKDYFFEPIQRLNIFRIIQEALHNVMKHSKADYVTVTVKGIKSKDKKIAVLICDNGTGISDKSIKKGLGMNSMQYRANQIGATFRVTDNKPKGTCIEVKM